MEDAMRDALLRIASEGEQEATKVLTCKRKAVCTSLTGGNLTVNFFNGPINDDAKRCTNQIGGCGCIHSEPKAMIWLAGHADLFLGEPIYVTVTHSPCTPCASLLYLMRKHIAGVYWLYDTPHDLRGIDILLEAGFKTGRLWSTSVMSMASRTSSSR